jgi:hypothetical protein
MYSNGIYRESNVIYASDHNLFNGAFIVSDIECAMNNEFGRLLQDAVVTYFMISQYLSKGTDHSGRAV